MSSANRSNFQHLGLQRPMGPVDTVPMHEMEDGNMHFNNKRISRGRAEEVLGREFLIIPISAL